MRLAIFCRLCLSIAFGIGLAASCGAPPTIHGDSQGGVIDQADDAVLPPAGGLIVWNSNRTGRSEIYRMRADGSEVVQLTTGGGETPLWSPEGRWIAYKATTDNSTWLMRPDGSDARRLFGGVPLFWMWDGSGLVCQSGYDFYVVDPEQSDARPLFRRRDFPHLADKMFQPGGITGDGRWLVAGTDRFRDGYSADNGDFKAPFAAVVLDLQDKSKLYFFGSGCAPRTPPAGSQIYHVCGDCPTHPDIYRMSVDDLTERVTYAPMVAYDDSDWGHTYFPRISNDNEWLVYGASTGCHDQAHCDYEIFTHPLHGPANYRIRLTHDAGNDRHPDLFIGLPQEH